nr:hypothetical protein [Oceanococcus sp. HetDA_MAG_MS8]
MPQNGQKVTKQEKSVDEYFSALLKEMNTPESIAAVDALFDMSAEDLGASHNPDWADRQPES